jgi:hypothetical protein
MNYKITHIIRVLRWKMALLLVLLVVGGQSVWGQGYRIYYKTDLYSYRSGIVYFTYKIGTGNEIPITQYNCFAYSNFGYQGIIKIDDSSKFYGTYTFKYSINGSSGI